MIRRTICVAIVVLLAVGSVWAQPAKRAKPLQAPSAPKKSAKPKKPAAPKKAVEKKAVGKDGVPIVFIPAGESLIGSPDGEGDADEHPQHRVFLDSFFIDQYEVTGATYETFVKTTGRTPPPEFVGDPPAVTGWLGSLLAVTLKEKPVIGVSWSDADAYCRWADKRLPTEAEWEKAARGTDARRYPWGNDEPDRTFANFAQPAWDSGSVLASMGEYETGKSPYGVYQMAGNVWEWVQDWYDDAFYAQSPDRNPAGPTLGSLKVIRGGSWVSGAGALRAANRDKSAPKNRQINLGLRCARAAK